MILVRDEVQCSPGGADALVAQFKQLSHMLDRQQVIRSARILTDLSGSFDTVVAEYEVESIDAYLAFMRSMFEEADRQPGEHPYVSGRRTYYTIEATFDGAS